MPESAKPHPSPIIQIQVLGQEGDEKTVSINPHEHCEQLLREGLHALYGHPGPNPDEYDIVFGGTWIEPLSKTVSEVGITNGVTVSILPKSISRGQTGVAHNRELTLDLIAEDLVAAERQAHSLGLTLLRGEGEHAFDLYVPYVSPDGEKYLVRLRCNGYDEQAPSFQFVNPDNVEETGLHWWPRMANLGCARGDSGEIVYCTPGLREYHQHPSHRNESHLKSTWKLARVLTLVWRYLCQSGNYVGRGGV